MTGLPDARPVPEMETRERLAPTPEVVAQARFFIATTLTRWDTATGTQLSQGWGRCDRDLLERLLAPALHTNGVFASSGWWPRAARSRWVRRIGTRYWLVMGPLRLMELLPRWEMQVEPWWTKADRRWPIVLTARAVLDDGVQRLRIEVWDTRLPEDMTEPEQLDRWKAALEPGCWNYGLYSPGASGVITWAEVDVSSAG